MLPAIILIQINSRTSSSSTLLRFWRRGYNGRMPLWAKGESTIKAPVYFGDIGLAIANAIDMPQSKGVTYEAYG